MRRSRLAIGLAASLAFPAGAQAIVIRHDVPDHHYRAATEDIPALADLPGEGHGVLIAPRWVVTVAHAVRDGAPGAVTIAGRDRAVSRLIVHPDFRFPPAELLGLSGDARPLMDALAEMDDIALLELTEPVEDVVPLPVHRAGVEASQVVTIYGKGASGNGLTGQTAGSPHRGPLRRAENRITSAQGRWLVYRFDEGESALPLEGMLGDGDSGGAVIMEFDGRTELVGLSDWKDWTGDMSSFRAGIYGQTSHHIRLSWYADWIDGVIQSAS